MAWKQKAEQEGIKNIDELNKYFDLSSLKEEEDIIPQIVDKIGDKVDNTIDLLNNLLNPDSTYQQIHDSQNIFDEEKKQIMSILKSLIIINKNYQALHLLPEKDKQLEFISESLESYKNFIPSILNLIYRLRDTYLSESQDKIDNTYFG